ncbi:hypothetical protein FRC15_002326 [Serendipita sp. 397]|nr:hypothetical protein FRC15_002326 [Serendipita sp. 397]
MLIPRHPRRTRLSTLSITSRLRLTRSPRHLLLQSAQGSCTLVPPVPLRRSSVNNWISPNLNHCRIRDIYAPRGSLPHVQVSPYSQDLQHQRSNSSPAFLTNNNVDTTSTIPLNNYANIAGALYRQRLASHQLYNQSLPSSVACVPSGPLPSSDSEHRTVMVGDGGQREDSRSRSRSLSPVVISGALPSSQRHRSPRQTIVIQEPGHS